MQFKELPISVISRERAPLMGLAILWVVIFHYGLSMPFVLISYLGFTGVDIFMFLSAYGLVRSLDNDPSPISFYKRRVLRIFPTYFLAKLNLGDEVEKYIIADNGAIIYSLNQKCCIRFRGMSNHIANKILDIIKDCNKKKTFKEIGTFIHIYDEDNTNKCIASNYKTLIKKYSALVNNLLYLNVMFFFWYFINNLKIIT